MTSSIQFDEGTDGYKHGGYAPVKIGDVYNNRYQVLFKIGFGHFSTVWQCAIVDDPNAPHVALKIQKSSATYTAAALDEITLLQVVNDKCSHNADNRLCQLLDTFTIETENGEHHVMVFPLMGHSVLSLIRRYHHRGLSISIVKHIMRQVLTGLSVLHDQAGIIHTDLKPENILLATSPASRSGKPYTDCRNPVTDIEAADALKRDIVALARRKVCAHASSKRHDELVMGDFDVRIVDLGNACFIDRHFCDVIQTRQYRSPEVILGSEYGPSADIWSAGCCLFELLTGNVLFEPMEVGGGGCPKDEDHLALMFELFGRPEPTDIMGRHSKLFFNRRGQLKHIKTLKFISLTTMLTETYDMPTREAEEVAEVLSKMLAFNPSHRPTAAQLLEMEWFSEPQ
ncbi:Protein kinase domain [Carpediemonas membranifera]|uniref:non-specific serine/threonine protein kinase n=1 Tax=Carpediemonas membranifera TaxID=201153 RepID=A0A8J6B628_9EUKA|nr:Protein kinase domain [Carpediemonas membranifera]|eukprot:KAG9393839.1 Protein kinase domain [Carpediemonas membranifera]